MHCISLLFNRPLFNSLLFNSLLTRSNLMTGFLVKLSPSSLGAKPIPVYSAALFKFNTSSTVHEVYVTAKSTDVIDDACSPLPKSTPDLKDKIVIVGRGTCLFGDKYKK